MVIQKEIDLKALQSVLEELQNLNVQTNANIIMTVK